MNTRGNIRNQIIGIMFAGFTIFAADGTEARFTEGIATDPVTGLTADLEKVFCPIGPT